jgi:catechol 2,3-dioxygenase-like lactoylglutathione lyase family enzyme
MKLNGICLITPNVPALAAFYATVLGVEAVGDDTHVELRVEGAGLAIFRRRDGAMAPGSCKGPAPGNVAIEFEVQTPTPNTAHRRPRRDVHQAAADHPWGARSFCSATPTQHRIFLRPTRRA